MQFCNAGCQVQCYTYMQMSSCLTASFSGLIRTERLQAVSVTYCVQALTGISVL